MKKVKLFEEFINEASSEEKEAKAILADLVDEWPEDELASMDKEDAEETVASYGHRGSKLKKITNILYNLTSTGTFEQFINESKGLELVHAYDKDGTMYGTGELVKKQGSKSLVRFDSETEKWFDNKDVKLVESNELDEATTSWSKMMKGVKDGGSGPWSLVAVKDGKVVAQKADIKIKDAIPAHFEALRKENPKAKIHIEDGGGIVVWNESKYNGNISGDAAEYIAKELSHYVKGIINQPNDAVTYFHLKDKSYKNKVIKTLKDIYGLDAQDGGILFSPSPTIKFDNDVILESFVNEAKKTITVTVFGGKEIQYTDKEIQELIDDLDLGADDLPKWIYVASLHNKSFPKKKEAILDLLKKIKDAKKSVSINVASDKPFQNEIVFEAEELDEAYKRPTTKIAGVYDVIVGKNPAVKTKVAGFERQDDTNDSLYLMDDDKLKLTVGTFIVKNSDMPKLEKGTQVTCKTSNGDDAKIKRVGDL